MSTLLGSSRAGTSNLSDFESLSWSPLGFFGVSESRMKLGMREAQKTCKKKRPRRLRGTMNDTGEWGWLVEPLPPSPLALASTLHANIVPEALAKSPFPFKVCRFAWGLNWGSTCNASQFHLWNCRVLAPWLLGPHPKGPLPPELSPSPSKDHQH